MERMKKVVISKDDLKSNLEIISSMKNENCKIIGVVKANGMGLGLLEYSRFLIENGIEILAVSEPEDALILRKNNIDKEILLLTPINNIEIINRLIENNITLTISSIKQVEIINDLEIKPVKVHIKIDTGLGRYGFLYYDIKEILKLFEYKNIEIEGIYTHFSNAINEKDTLLQFKRFEKIINKIEEMGYEIKLKHCCNSTAFIKYPNMHLNSVRLRINYTRKNINKNKRFERNRICGVFIIRS